MAYSVSKADLIDYPASAICGFHSYGFEWIDNLHFVLPPELFVAPPDSYVKTAKECFAKAGWAGDGDVGLLWLPPFVFPRALNVPPEGVIVWHVKQEEDGVSFLLSPIPLPFEEFGGTEAA